ncbi:MAG: SRPBCC family protein [Candidatus Sumerlaeia bacterium]|nr:SRPBCC family protein [Candidatus Sumerlaeia bacterium]
MSTASDREIVTTRLFDAPRDLVFSAWSDARHVSNWWGPHGFRTTTHEMDVRPGGVWRFTMHGPDGVDYPNKIVYREVVRPERLVYNHAGEEDFDHIRFHAVVLFEEEAGGTRVTLRTIFESADACRLVIEKHGAVEGAQQTLERLGRQLEVLLAEQK